MKDASEFAALATRFVEVIDAYAEVIGAPPSDRIEWLVSIEGLLGQLFGLAYRLPDTEVTSAAPTLGVRDPAIGLSDALGEANTYWSVIDPVAAIEPDAAFSLLSLDLAEIYVDLKGGLDLWERGLRNDAIFEWRLGFLSHTDRHALKALTALRARLYW